MEVEFRSYIKRLLAKSGFFSISVEHAAGGTAGAPDLLVLVGALLMPVELKVGDYAKNATIACSRIRPAQIRLLDELAAAGCRARLLIGVPVDRGASWHGFLLRDMSRKSLARWHAGFPSDRPAMVMAVADDELLLKPDRW